jgi:hypothetical protein
VSCSIPEFNSVTASAITKDSVVIAAWSMEAATLQAFQPLSQGSVHKALVMVLLKILLVQKGLNLTSRQFCHKSIK